MDTPSQQLEALKAQNFAVVCDILQYRKSKLSSKSDALNALIFSSVPLQDDIHNASALMNVSVSEILSTVARVTEAFNKMQNDFCKNLTVLSKDNPLYPSLLAQVKDGANFLFAEGNIDLLKRKCVSVVGTRNPSPEGIKRARKIATLLSQKQFTIVSGLAKGIDTAAHRSSIECGGSTIAVIGTPLTTCYPKENSDLQEQIARNHLLISQFPPSQPVSKYNFPLRNLTMGGLSLATVIVEAGETSGALYQAKFCIDAGRKLFLMKSLFDKPELTWPRKYLKKGAIILSEVDQLYDELASFTPLPKEKEHLNSDQQLQIFNQTQ